MKPSVCKNGNRPRGIKRKIFGASLLSVGLLNSMLTLKSGIAPDAFNYLIVVGGVIVFCSGLWRKAA